MPGLVIDGKPHAVDRVDVQSWLDHPNLRRSSEDGRSRRTSWVRSIILHTTKGLPGRKGDPEQTVRPGADPVGDRDLRVARFWKRSDQSSGTHLVIDTDGGAVCIADLARETMFHAANRGVNNVSVGIENYQLDDASFYEATLDSCVALCDAICIAFGIQRQFHWPYRGRPVSRLGRGGRDCVGLFGHRDVSNRRGRGDPGDLLFDRLRAAGYEAMDFDRGEDLDVWTARQRELGVDADGIAGPATRRALIAAGYAHGLWTLGRDTTAQVR